MKTINDCSTCMKEGCADCDAVYNGEDLFGRITATVFVTAMLIMLAYAYIVMEWIPAHSGEMVCAWNSWFVAIPFVLTISFGGWLIYRAYIKWRLKHDAKRIPSNQSRLPLLLVSSGAVSSGGGVYSQKLKHQFAKGCVNASNVL